MEILAHHALMVVRHAQVDLYALCVIQDITKHLVIHAYNVILAVLLVQDLQMPNAPVVQHL